LETLVRRKRKIKDGEIPQQPAANFVSSLPAIASAPSHPFKQDKASSPQSKKPKVGRSEQDVQVLKDDLRIIFRPLNSQKKAQPIKDSFFKEIAGATEESKAATTAPAPMAPKRLVI
jgi:hypothetical protein